MGARLAAAFVHNLAIELPAEMRWETDIPRELQKATLDPNLPLTDGQVFRKDQASLVVERICSTVFGGAADAGMMIRA